MKTNFLVSQEATQKGHTEIQLLISSRTDRLLVISILNKLKCLLDETYNDVGIIKTIEGSEALRGAPLRTLEVAFRCSLPKRMEETEEL